MRRVFEEFAYSIRRLLSGRYGNDELNLFLSRFTMFLLLICLFIRVPVLYSVALVSLFVMVYRSLSKNYSARAREREKFLVLKGKVTSKINLRREIWQHRKTHRYFICKNCKATLRVPRGKGKIEITCRKCGYKMRKRS
ncbi:MAG: hypothetical protein IJO50_04715 [Clostridia bacterium]|nr:hypothetical protein [Clostridia bacterium]